MTRIREEEDWTLCSALTDPNHRFYLLTRIEPDRDRVQP